MTANPAQVVQVTCPNCRAAVRAQVFTFVDVGQYPELKSALVAGQLNVAVCRNCGTPAMISAPIIYHDPAKQLFLVFVPQQGNLRPDDIERLIGEATNLSMRSLPPDAPRAHLLAPRRFLTLNSLVDTILEADGVTREMVEAQQLRVELISRLAEAFEQGEQIFSEVVEQLRPALDYEFYTMLTQFIEASTQSGNAETAQLLITIRDRALAVTGGIPEASGDRAAFDDEPFEDIDLSEAVNRLIEAPNEHIEALIGELRPVIDDEFFQEWTQRIDTAEQVGDLSLADHLTKRRALLHETVERMDRQAQEMFERGAQILDAVLQAPDLDAALREQGAKVDESFLLVLEAHIGAAQRAGRTEVVERLMEIERLATKLLQEQLSPEDRFINELLSAETPQAATKLLRQNPVIITPTFVKRLNELADESEQAERRPLGERLRQLAREAGAMLF